MAEQARTDRVTATARRCTGSHKLSLTDMLEEELIDVVVATLINDLSEEFTGRL